MAEDFPPLGTKPDLCAAARLAASAMVYESPLTGSRPEPPVTRNAQAEGRGGLVPTMEERLAALKPNGRVQRKEWLDEDAKTALKVALQRERRAQTKRLQEACGVLMQELARYDLPLVQLQLAEYASEPSNLDKAGSMRIRFLGLYGTCCNTKHTDSSVRHCVNGCSRPPAQASSRGRTGHWWIFSYQMRLPAYRRRSLTRWTSNKLQ